MLNSLHIRNYVIVDELELEFTAGMTALTGETGAGKSIMIGALKLVLGERADAAVVREGAKRTEIQASFTAPPALQAWLAEQELDADADECALRRVISAEGRSKAWINGSSVPLATLRQVSEQLIEIHGQHANQRLLKSTAQRDAVDALLTAPVVAKNAHDSWAQWRQTQKDIEQLSGGEQDRDQRLELLRYQVQELDELALTDERLQQLNEDFDRLAHAETVLQSAHQAADICNGEQETNLQSLLAQAAQLLQSVVSHEPRLAEAEELLQQAGLLINEASAALRNVLDATEIDPQRLQQLDQQLGDIQNFARKHRIDAAALPQKHVELAAELATLENSEIQLAQLQSQLQAQLKQYRQAAGELSAARTDTAATLSQSITEGVQSLGMPHAQCSIHIAYQEDAAPTAKGNDVVEIRFSANPGQPLQPLAKVASGGELARVSLAIQVATAAAQPVPTMIFDEVDTGIGGAVAEMVGRKLADLGQHCQIFCVTHLPQVAAQASQQLQVSKQTDGQSTQTSIDLLEAEQRIEEIARMLGGVDITEHTRQHAAELLQR